MDDCIHIGKTQRLESSVYVPSVEQRIRYVYDKVDLMRCPGRRRARI